MSQTELEDPTPVGKKSQDQKSKRFYLAENIQRRIEELGTTAAKVVEAAGLNISFITYIYNGKSRNPKLESLEALAAALDTTISWLLEDHTANQTGAARGETRRPPYNSHTKIPVVGMIETGTYRITADVVRRIILGPLHRDFPQARPFALEVRDAAMNAAKPIPYLIGFDALYIDLNSENLLVESGNIYAIRRARDIGDRPPRIEETFIRRARVFADRVELNVETDHPGDFGKITVPGRLTTNPDEPIYAFGLVYAAIGFSYQI